MSSQAESLIPQMMKKRILLAVWLLSLFACNSKTSEQKVNEASKKDISQKENAKANETSSNIASQNTWEGTFLFSENLGKSVGGTPINYTYSIEFSQDGSVYYNIDGYQTMVRAICSIQEKDDKTADLFFTSFGEEDLFKSQFAKGQLIATLIKIDENKIRFLEDGKKEKGIFERVK